MDGPTPLVRRSFGLIAAFLVARITELACWAPSPMLRPLLRLVCLASDKGGVSGGHPEFVCCLHRV